MIKNKNNILALSGNLSFTEIIKAILSLAKVRITFFVSITTGIGYLLEKGSLDFFALIPITFVFLLASAASVINQIQEIKYDKLMERTKERPLPSGKFSVNEALVFTLMLIVFSLFLAIKYLSFTVLALGLLNLLWYNLIYTPLKRKTALAIIPGSLVGAIPPVIGYLSAGGTIFENDILLLSAYFFIWQIPHFWLLIILYGREYQDAGYPTLYSHLSGDAIKLLTFFLNLILALYFFLYIQLGIVTNQVLILVGLISSFAVIFYSAKILRKKVERVIFRNLFMFINIYVLTIVFIIAIEKLTR